MTHENCTAVLEFVGRGGAKTGKNIVCKDNIYGRCMIEVLEEMGYQVLIQSGRCHKLGKVGIYGEISKN